MADEPEFDDVVARVKELLRSLGVSQEDGREVLLDIIADSIAEQARGDLAELGKASGYCTTAIVKMAAEKSFKKFIMGGQRISQPPVVFPPGYRPSRPPVSRNTPIAYAHAVPPTDAERGILKTAGTHFTVEGKTVPAFVQEQAGKWSVLLCYGSWEPGQILKGVERQEYDSEAAAKKALEEAVSDLSGTIEPWSGSSAG